MSTRIFRAEQAVYLPEDAETGTRPVLGPVTVVIDGETIVSVTPGLTSDIHAGHDAEIIDVPTDQVLIPGLVGHANAPTLLEQARREKGEPEPLDRQLLLLARCSGEAGFSLNDALLAIQPPEMAQLDAVRKELERMQLADLLLVTSDERGRVVYREP